MRYNHIHLIGRNYSVSLYTLSFEEKKEKVDVFNEGKYICTIGAYGMSEYPTYLKNRGKEYAEERRRLYRLRNKKDNIFGSAGFYS